MGNWCMPPNNKVTDRIDNRVFYDYISQGKKTMVRKCIKHKKVDIQVVAKRALEHAAHSGNVKMLCLLLKYPVVKDSADWSLVLGFVTLGSHLEALKFLLEYVENHVPSKAAQAKRFALGVAVYNHDLSLIDFLLLKAADVKLAIPVALMRGHNALLCRLVPQKGSRIYLRRCLSRGKRRFPLLRDVVEFQLTACSVYSNKVMQVLMGNRWFLVAKYITKYVV